MGPFEMDRTPDIPETFAELKYDSVRTCSYSSSLVFLGLGCTLVLNLSHDLIYFLDRLMRMFSIQLRIK